MDDEGLERLRRLVEERERQPAVETVRELLGFYVNDAESVDEIRLRVRGSRTWVLEGELRALDTLLAEPQPPGLLSRLVTRDVNRSLSDTSDEAAAALLRQIAEILREVLAEAEHKRSAR